MAKIVWTREAIARLRDIHEYIAVDSPRSAVNVVRGIYSKVQLLRAFPLLGQRYEYITDRHVREVIYGNYRIPYLVVDESNITILGVFHSAMDIESYLH